MVVIIMKRGNTYSVTWKQTNENEFRVNTLEESIRMGVIAKADLGIIEEGLKDTSVVDLDYTRFHSGIQNLRGIIFELENGTSQITMQGHVGYLGIDDIGTVWQKRYDLLKLSILPTVDLPTVDLKVDLFYSKLTEQYKAVGSDLEHTTFTMQNALPNMTCLSTFSSKQLLELIHSWKLDLTLAGSICSSTYKALRDANRAVNTWTDECTIAHRICQSLEEQSKKILDNTDEILKADVDKSKLVTVLLELHRHLQEIVFYGNRFHCKDPLFSRAERKISENCSQAHELYKKIKAENEELHSMQLASATTLLIQPIKLPKPLTSKILHFLYHDASKPKKSLALNQQVMSEAYKILNSKTKPAVK